MRLLMVGNFFASDLGVYQYCSALALKFEEGGYQVVRTSFKARRVPRLLDMLKTVVARSRDYDVALIDVFSGPAFLWAEMAAWMANRVHKPVVLALHGGALPRFAARHPGRVRRLLQGATTVTSPSSFLRNALGRFRRDIEHIPNALDLHRYEYRLRERVQPAFVWLRALARDYRPEIAVEALALVRRRFPGATLHLVGPDKGDGTLDRVCSIVARRGLEVAVTVTGAVGKEDVPGALNGADVFLNTTTVESFGVSVMEAAACGLCIVTTDVGELKYIWQDKRNALLVAAEDAQAMASAMTALLDDPQLAARLSANARSTAERFGWPMIFPKWERLLAGVLAERNRGAGARRTGATAR